MVRHHFPGTGSCMAGGTDRHQLLWSMDSQFLLHLPGAGALYLRNPGTSPSALWPSSYADHTAELHILWRNLHHPYRGQRRLSGIWPGSPVACMGHGPDQPAECRGYHRIPEPAHRHNPCPL